MQPRASGVSRCHHWKCPRREKPRESNCLHPNVGGCENMLHVWWVREIFPENWASGRLYLFTRRSSPRTDSGKPNSCQRRLQYDDECCQGCSKRQEDSARSWILPTMHWLCWRREAEDSDEKTLEWVAELCYCMMQCRYIYREKYYSFAIPCDICISAFHFWFEYKVILWQCKPYTFSQNKLKGCFLCPLFFNAKAPIN